MLICDVCGIFKKKDQKTTFSGFRNQPFKSRKIHANLYESQKGEDSGLSKGRNHFSRATIQTGQTLTNYLDPFHQSH